MKRSSCGPAACPQGRAACRQRTAMANPGDRWGSRQQQPRQRLPTCSMTRRASPTLGVTLCPMSLCSMLRFIDSTTAGRHRAHKGKQRC